MKQLISEIKGLDRDREHLWVISTNCARKIIEIDLVTKGTKDAVDVSAKEIFCAPLKNRASGIILVHNHPSGNVEPSKNDIETTGGLVWVGNFLDIPVKDHIIISSETYYSFKTNDMLHTSSRKSDDVVKIVKNIIDTQLNVFKNMRKQLS